MTAKRIIITLCILITILCVVWSFWGESLLVRWFGPPKVRLAEEYANDRGDLTFDHSRFTALLQRHVRPNGEVDYAGLRADESELSAYLKSLAEVHFVRLTRDAKLALMINAYNAFTLKLVVEYLPKVSIKQIPEESRWQDERWTIGGRVFSLHQLEHDELRAKFIEPRIHFAINCASKSCPPLRREAYSGPRLEKQLSEQARRFNESIEGCSLAKDGEEVWLSRIYLWYRDDFEQVEGDLLDYVAKWDAPLAERLKGEGRPEIKWIDYDWSLNDVSD